MHYARLDSSPRLQRALRALQANEELSSMQLIIQAQVAAVSSVVAELRFNGAEIICSQRWVKGKQVHFYRLIRSPEGWD